MCNLRFCDSCGVGIIRKTCVFGVWVLVVFVGGFGLGCAREFAQIGSFLLDFGLLTVVFGVWVGCLRLWILYF